MDTLLRYGGVYKLDNHGRVIELSLETCALDGAALNALKQLTELRTLSLAGTGACDGDIATLSSLMKLKSLKLDRTSVTDDGLVLLEKLGDLRWLWLRKCEGISKKGVASFKKALPGIRVYVAGR